MLVLKNAIRRDMPYLNNHIATLLVIYRSIITYNHIGLLLDYVRLCIDATQPTIIIKGVMKNDPIYAARRESLPFSNGMRFQMCDPNSRRVLWG